MNDALAASIAETGATLLRHRWSHAGHRGGPPDEWVASWALRERRFGDPAAVLAIVAHARRILDAREAADRALIRRPPSRRRPAPTPDPAQFILPLGRAA